MQKLGIVLLASVLGAGTVAAETVVELFQRAKEQVKSGSYADALKTVDALDQESRKPGLEKQRAQLEPALALFRGVALAGLGKGKEAAEQFEGYLASSPNATLDPAVYPRKAVVAMEQARKNIDARGAAGMPSLALSYRAFRPDASTANEPPRADWADGPARFLLTPEEKREWAGLKDSVARSELIEKFWAARDPTPGTPQNEMRQEFERRVAFADANFGHGEIYGSMSDRGMVFVLLGPPTYAGRKPIRSGDDSNDSMTTSTVGSHDVQIAEQTAKETARTSGQKMTNSQQQAISDRINAPSATMSDSSADANREIWHYRRELLPPGVPYQQVDFDFITRVGYGFKTLQRDPAPLATLDAASHPAAWTPAALLKKN